MRIGIDLGGTKIEGVAMGAAGEILSQRRVQTPQGDYPQIISTIAGLVRLLEDDTGQQGSVGVGMPGAVSRVTGRIKNSNSTCLIGQSLDKDLETALNRPIRCANDADCFALSEAVDGAGAGARSLFGVILGTGVGGGLVIRGALHQGPNDIAGEWGHNPLPWPETDEWLGPFCYCGKRGCVESYLSGPGLVASYNAMTGLECSSHEIVALADQQNEGAVDCLSRYERRLAKALAMVINIFDPEVVVLGGGLSNLTRLYSAVPRLWGRYVFSDEVHTKLMQARHGDSSGVRGAAWLWQEGEMSRGG